MKLGIAQIATGTSDIERTIGRMESYARRASDEGVELLVFPHATLTGARPVPFAAGEGFVLDLVRGLSRLADVAPCACLVPVTVELEDGPFTEVVLISEGEAVPLRMADYVGSLMSGEGAADFEPGDGRQAAPDGFGPLTVDVRGCRIGVALSQADLDMFVEYDFAIEGLVYICELGFALDDPASVLGSALSENGYLKDAQDMDVWLAAAGSLGGYGTEVFTGSSFVCTAWGELIACAPAFEETLLTCDVDAYVPGFLERPLAHAVFDRPLHLWESLVMGLRDYVRGVGRSDVAVALHGGLSGMLLLALATDAIGPTHVHALLSPEAGQEVADRMSELARNLRIDFHVLRDVDLLPRVARAGGMEVGDGLLLHDMVEARLAHLGRALDAVVLSDWDKTGLALESDPCSLDAGTLAPFGDVYRSDLIALARLRNTISPVIPNDFLAGVTAPRLPVVQDPALSSEDWLERIDSILASHVEWEMGLTAIVRQGTDPALASAVLDALYESERGRRGRPGPISVSSATLAGMAVPLGLQWRDRVRTLDEMPAGEDLLRTLDERLGDAVDSAGVGERDDDASAELRNTLGMLRDFSDSRHPQPSETPGPVAHPGWDRLFSEN